MRLLQYSGTGGYQLTEPFTSSKATPSYAILSHTWGADADEVTFNDLTNGTGTDKSGYEKIRFCGEQARQDGLDYFWIDTCCINKENKAELSRAINSMFRWYRDATRCYVYLSDVSTAKRDMNGDTCDWEPAFRSSRWFTRGWTLQELVAPRSAEFFSRQRKRLGDKDTLRKQIHEITTVPEAALQGELLSQFSVNDRLSWIEHRETKLEEDKVYSLLGIFDVFIPPIYGEGAGSAFQRLLNEIDKLEKCTRDLHITDPRRDKVRIEETKGGLLEDLNNWIFENPDFQRWLEGSQSRLLWIKGDPGKGKTMLVCSIINELNKSIAKTTLLSYFFCQATDSRINSATTVLRGLLFMLVTQQPSLISHLRKKYDQTGKALFEDANAWVALSEIFTDIVRNPDLTSTYLIIDALDECVTDLPKLLNLIVQTSSASSRVKWIVSGRNWPNIEEHLERAEDKVRLSLELNAESVSAAVHSYIKQKVLQLAQDKKYSDQTKQAVLDYLYTNANNSFLWVALVCQNLGKMSRLNVVTKLKAFPPGLDSLYERMIKNINDSEDADIFRCALAIVAVVYRPITLHELTLLMEELDSIGEDLDLAREVIGFCGSLLTIRDGIIYFVHQSAKDFLIKEAHTIFPSGSEVVHYAVLSRSLLAMSNTLRRDMYGLVALGYPIEQVQRPEPDPLAASRYSCIYWIDHLCDCSSYAPAHAEEVLRSGGTVDTFLREKYIYWLEALSLCRSISKGVVSIARLEALTNKIASGPSLAEVVRDAHRYIMYYKSAIESSPLQAYSVLLFSPTRSVIRALFKHEEPKGMVIKRGIQEQWSNCLLTLEGHSSPGSSVAYSHDSTRLASASQDRKIKVWDAYSGECLKTLTDIGSVTSVVFSHDSTRLASGSYDGTVSVWDTHNGECLRKLEDHSSVVWSVAFSHDSNWIASGSRDGTVKVWDAHSGECLETLEDHNDAVRSVAFSHDSTRLASGSEDCTVKLWDTRSGECLKTLEDHSSFVSSVVFSHDSTRLASASWDHTVKVWNPRSGECLKTLKGHDFIVSSVAFSHDSTQLTSASHDGTIKVWDAHSGDCLLMLQGKNSPVYSVDFSHNSTQLASTSEDGTVKVWDAYSNNYVQALESHSDTVCSIGFSHDLTQLVSASTDGVVKVWDTYSGKCLQTLEGHNDSVSSVAFSHDSTRLASASDDCTVKVWDAYSGECLQTLEGHRDWVTSVAFSHDSTWLASASGDYTVKVWDAYSGKCLQTLKDHNDSVHSAAFSHDSTQLASASRDCTVKVWDAYSGKCLQTLKGHNRRVSSVAFSHDSTRVASASWDYTVKVWDPRSGECLSTLKVGCVLEKISLYVTDSYIQTDIGIIDVSVSSSSIPSSGKPEPQCSQYHSLTLSTNHRWIKYGSDNLLWLPLEYRPSCSAVSGGVVVIGVQSGEVWIFEVHSSKS